MVLFFLVLVLLVLVLLLVILLLVLLVLLLVLIRSARQIRGFDGRKHCGENQKHFEKFLRHGISATGNFTVRDPEIRIGKKKITGKNAITENDLEKMHETMDEL